MNMYDLNEIYEMLKRNGYVEKEDNISSSIPDIDPSGGADSNCCANVNLDIPGGFQDINPMFFLTIGEVIGNIISGSVPFNVAVAISNWLNLVGQAIETYGAQQQYFQNGPGRYYDLRYKNVNKEELTYNPISYAEENSNEVGIPSREPTRPIYKFTVTGTPAGGTTGRRKRSLPSPESEPVKSQCCP